MSDQISGGAAEHLESSSGRPLPRTRGRARRKLVAGVGALAVLGAGAGALWAWQAFMDQGPQPAEALPASTLGYVAVDFDPGAGQKLAALGFLRKFPSLEKHAGLTGADDLRKDAFDGLEADLGCGLGYADLEPWVGTRFAFAVVDQGGPTPVAVVQVADRAKAATGLRRVADCADGELGYALGDGWAVLAETDQVAERVVRDAATSPLSEDTEFQHWTGEAGDPGVATLYAAPEAGPALVSAFEDSPYGTMYLPSVTGFDPLNILVMSSLTLPMPADYSSDEAVATDSAVEARPAPKADRQMKQLEKELRRLDEMTPAEQEAFFKEQDGLFAEEFGKANAGSGSARGPAPGRSPGHKPVAVDEQAIGAVGEDAFPQPAIPAEQRAALMNFSGLGGVVRFDDGALELELVSDRIEGTIGNLVAGTAGDDVLAELPADTAAVFGAGLRNSWGPAFVERFAESGMPFQEPPADAVAAFEKDSGLTVADLEALGGDSFALVAGPGLDPEQLFMDPTATEAAARISGNADAVEVSLTKLRDRMPASDRGMLHWRRVGDDVMVGANAAYLDELAASGNLTGSGSFQNAVPDAADAASVFYLNFDAGNWLANAVGTSDRADAEPLAGFGYSLQDEGDKERTLLRLTTED